jgi:Ca2+-dependent lipid-binding protein
MDPFIQVTYNGQQYRTETCQEGGTDPKWNQTLSIPIVNPQKDSIKIECLEEDLVVNDFVGAVEISIKRLIS